MTQLLETTHPRVHAPQQGKSPKGEACTLQLEKACVQQWRTKGSQHEQVN